MQELISVIIPVYNTGEFLKRCIESILNQTYHNIEIILIDDGSNDGVTDKICDRFSEEYSHIRCIHKENSGQGAARNIGLEVAMGKFVAFVDSDDWVDSDMYSVLYNNMIKYDSDISCCNNGATKDEDTRKIILFEQPEIMREHLFGHKGTGHSPCDKLYKKELFKNVSFLPIRAYEDCATIFKVFANAHKIVYEDITLYHYEIRENSTMTQKFSAIKFESIKAYYGMYEFYKKYYPDYIPIVKAQLIGSIQYCIGETFVSEQEEILSNELTYAKDVLKAIGFKNISLKHKITMVLMLYFDNLYMCLYRKMH